MKTNNRIHRDSPVNNGSGISIVTAACKAQLTVAISGIVLLLCFCGIAYSMDDPDSVIKPLSLCALFLSAFCGGFSAVRLSGDGVVSGICAGIVTVALFFLLSLLPVWDPGDEWNTRLLTAGCAVASSAAGAIIGKRRGSAAHQKRKTQAAKKRRG